MDQENGEQVTSDATKDEKSQVQKHLANNAPAEEEEDDEDDDEEIGGETGNLNCFEFN